MDLSKTAARARQCLEWGIYLGLLVYCYIVVSNSIHDYMEGKTDFRTKQMALNFEDQPTLTVCFPHNDQNGLVYGVDFFVGVLIEEEESTLC